MQRYEIISYIFRNVIIKAQKKTQARKESTVFRKRQLKTEVIYREQRFKNHQNAKERIGGFIQFYNEQRPHASIGMKVPSQVHKEQGEQKCLWARKESTKSVRSQLF